MGSKETSVNLNCGGYFLQSPAKELAENAVESCIFRLHSNWKKIYKKRDEVRSEQERLLWTKATPLLRRLVEGDLPKDDETDVLKKMVDLCILLSGLGSSNTQAVVKETYPALLSVMKAADVARFVDLSAEDRKEHLLELAQIVMGIRLFNKDCRKGGAGIEDLPNILSRSAKSTSYKLDKELTAVIARCSLFTATLNKVYYLDNERSSPELKTFIPEQFNTADLDAVKAATCFSRLHHEYLSEIYSQLRDSELHIRTCVEQLRSTLLQLHETVRYRSAIPTIQVYPLFVQLSIIWRELQHETAVLSHITELVDSLKAVAADVEEPALVKFYSRNLSPDTYITCCSSTEIKLKGFCPWTLIQTKGALIPGTFITDKYSFRSPSIANFWLEDPKGARTALQTILKSYPYLLLFFDFPYGTPRDSPMPEFEEPVAETQECGIQTETHPVASYIDKDYTWSVWEMKRRALQMSKLVGCVTKSQQTEISAFRRSKFAQTTIKKDRGVGPV